MKKPRIAKEEEIKDFVNRMYSDKERRTFRDEEFIKLRY